MLRQWWWVIKAEKLIKAMIANVERPLTSWVCSYPAQVGLHLPAAIMVNSSISRSSRRGGSIRRWVERSGRQGFINYAKRAAICPRSHPISRSLR